MRRLRAGVIGLGVGEEHVAGYQGNPDCDLVALCDNSEEKLARAREKYPGVRLTKHADEVVGDDGVDVVSIASYDDAHFGQAVAALRAGKHVFVEKPLCRSLDELRLLKQVWSQGEELKLASNLVLRAAPIYEWVHATIRAGGLGEVYAFDGDYLYGRLDKITEGWRKDVPEYSVMQGGGIHLVDLMLWLCGQRPTSVTAVGNRVCTDGTGFRYNDYVAATFRFASGLVGRITANFGCVHRHQHVVRVFGTQGTFVYDDLGPRLHTSRDPAVPATPLDLAPLPKSRGDLIPAFVRAIVSGEDTRRATQHEFDVISACVAADEAMATGLPAAIQYV